MNKELTRNWIAYLKNNQIVDLKPNEQGRLNYRRKVTTDDLYQFLNGRFRKGDIDNAINQVIHPALNKDIQEGLAKFGLLEEILDKVDYVDEAQVEKIFDILSQPRENVNTKFDQIKHIIKSKLNNNQIEELYKLLKNSNISESALNVKQIKNMLTNIPTEAGFLGYKKVDQNKLIQAWKDNGYTTNIKDIEELLSNAGFSGRQIYSMLNDTIKNARNDVKLNNDKALSDLSKYIITNNLGKDVIQFLEDNYEFLLLENRLGRKRRID